MKINVNPTITIKENDIHALNHTIEMLEDLFCECINNTLTDGGKIVCYNHLDDFEWYETLITELDLHDTLRILNKLHRIFKDATEGVYSKECNLPIHFSD